MLLLFLPFQVQTVLHQHQLTSLTNAVLRMTYYFIVLATVQPNLQQALFKYNLMSGLEEEAPAGWYQDVASLIPVNRRTGLLIAAGATYLKRVAEGEKRKLDLNTTDVRTSASLSLFHSLLLV
jgi:hypothetical protein